jgi:hypothetical protein
MNVHAPIEYMDALVKVEFYQELERTYDSTFINDTKIAFGVPNAKVGE